MTPATLARLRALDVAATPGPWRAEQEDTQAWIFGGRWHVACVYDRASDAEPEPAFDEECLANAALIAEVRTHLPALLDAAEERDRLKEERRQTSYDSEAVRDVLKERRDHVTREGWTLEHDDAHAAGDLVRAAINYAAAASLCLDLGAKTYSDGPPLDWLGSATRWPWAAEWWKPKDVRRNLVRAASLIIAEIERNDRALAAEIANHLEGNAND